MGKVEFPKLLFWVMGRRSEREREGGEGRRRERERRGE